jgi:LysM repeat protein
MNHPNPFVPKGSILEQQSKRRSRLKLAVFCVIAVGVAGLSAMLIQGCKREQPAETPDNTPVLDTNPPAITDTNPPASTNPPIIYTPPVTNPPPYIPPVAPATTEYTVVKGDTLATIAKKNGVTLKALEAANPTVVPTKLKINQKLEIPAPTGGTTSSAAAPASPDMTAVGDTYTVKSGDTLGSIAKAHGVSLKALVAANNLTADQINHIKVKQVLKLPAKAEAAAPAPAAPEPVPAAPAPIVNNLTPPSTTPAH